MVANGQSRTASRDDDIATMTPITDDVSHVKHAIISTLMHACPHCQFKCASMGEMTQHSWEEHPLLMRRKKHLIPTLKADDDGLKNQNVFQEKTETHVVQTAHEMQNCYLSGNVASNNKVRQSQETDEYREKAIRSISLLSTAAAILESQSASDRQLPTLKHPENERLLPIQPIPINAVEQYLTPVYRAYVPTLNQYVTIPVSVTSIPNRNPANPYLQYFQHAQQSSLGERISQSYPRYVASPQKMTAAKPQSQPTQTSEQIRNLLTSNSASLPTKGRSQVCATRKPAKTQRTVKQPACTDSKASDHCPLGHERRRQLEEALLSMDCCDINDSSTTMPFKCSDGVWRMVKFKCIRGLWVVQTPQSDTPTVYVPCDDGRLNRMNDAHIPCRSVAQKRKLLETNTDIDAKRLCASAPVFPLDENNNVPTTSLKRAMSNPLLTRSLPAPSQFFTNKEGKRVNISVVNRTNPPASCNLIKSLLLRKASPTMASSPSGYSSSSGVVGSQCSPKFTADTNPMAAALSKTWLKSSMAF